MRKRSYYKKREYSGDYNFGRADISRFINYLMQKGKKSVAEKVFYDSFEEIKKSGSDEPIKVFEKAMENVSPTVELRSKRVGGANYQVPIEVRPERRTALAIRWIVESARAQKGKPMAARLAEEFVQAFNNAGGAIKKKQDVHRMAEANKAFAHFSW